MVLTLTQSQIQPSVHVTTLLGIAKHRGSLLSLLTPKRYVDEDYDEGVAEVLMDLASYRTHVPSSQPLPPPARASP